jgi:hypothetical protein
MNPKKFECCPECGGKAGVAIEQSPVYSQRWGDVEKRILFYAKAEKISCIDCGHEFSVKNPDTNCKES